MQKSLVRKGVVAGIIVLFVGANVTQIVASNELFFYNTESFNMALTNGLRNIMLTGYWNPTGQMIAPFSNDTYLNPDGWKGANWEGWGYNIYSFFPTPGTYNGTFEVDYQDTWEDFWNITEEIHPVAIISFGAGNGPWEIEYNARNLDSWVNDYEPPYQPTPCPPDDSVPAGYVRHSTLPVQAIANAVNDQTSVGAWIDWNGSPGGFLCGYIAYLGMWYQALHNTTDDPYQCLAAGFIHVRSNIEVEDAMEATNVTIREVIKYLLNDPPDAPTIIGPTIGNNGTSYTYTTSTTDPEGDTVYYMWDWGDSNCSGWIGPYNSGDEASALHSWANGGLYNVKVKAKDIYGVESDWSASLLVRIVGVQVRKVEGPESAPPIPPG